MSYAVIAIDKDYEDIEVVEIWRVFDTLKEAETYIEKDKEQNLINYRPYFEYINLFVRHIQPSFENIQRYLSKDSLVSPKDFHWVLKNNLINGYGPIPEGFNPPAKAHTFTLYVSEIPKQENE
jgi:hypothetical protein